LFHLRNLEYIEEGTGVEDEAPRVEIIVRKEIQPNEPEPVERTNKEGETEQKNSDENEGEKAETKSSSDDSEKKPESEPATEEPVSSRVPAEGEQTGVSEVPEGEKPLEPQATSHVPPKV
jgi:hypothetical protein